MREIRFRGRNYDGIWMYGYLMPTPKPQIHLGNKHCVCACPQKMSKVDVVLYEVEESTIGQYTGLKDKNGKEIYEGDIIRSYDSENNPIIHYIHWHNSNACYVATMPQYPCICSIVTKDWIEEYDKEIIGNIHDNPELIKEEK